MSKLVKINDRKPIEIYIGRKTRGPVSGIRLSDEVIGRILRSVDGPKDVYAVGPNNVLVKLTLDNYTKSEEELFNLKPVTPVVDEDEAKAKAEALRKSLEAKKNAEAKVVEVKSEPTEPVVEEKTVETVVEPEVQVDEKVETVEPAVEEIKEDATEEAPVVNEAPAEEKKAEVTPKNNYNNKYNNYNKNHKNKR